MDLSNRSTQPQPAAPAAHTPAQPSASSTGRKESRRGGDKSKWARVVYVAIIAGIAILIGAIAIIAGSSSKPENEYVDTNKLQAVFLNTGQVYFGHVKTLNDKYFRVTDIYYLQANNSNGGSSSSSTNSASNVTLVKLGCELHEPYDQMIINSDQVTFWENLQDNGQVAKAVATFEKQNPQGQKCADQSSSASTNSSSNTQNANTSNSGSNGSTTGTTNTTGSGSTSTNP